ncbi:MAG: adenylosuccinate lyase, partial [Anaerolineae bacterium]|nr:adenylosuccinate lyase [Anaerolineae bacterium]
HSLLERTLDDSGNRREVLPSAFLAVDELLLTAQRVIGDLRIYDGAIERTLAAYGDFAATERLLMALVAAGADRQEMHEVIRQHAMAAWQAVQESADDNPLAESLCGDPKVLRHLSQSQVLALFDARAHIGDAPERSRALARRIRATLQRTASHAELA